jgi:MFS family permease
LDILAKATFTFAIAVTLLGVGLPLVAGAIAAMAVFALAEMLFTPMVSTTFSRITSVSRLTASNLQGVAWTFGEAFGSLSGGAIFLICYRHGTGNLYWLLLAAVTMAGAVPFLGRRRRAERTNLWSQSADACPRPHHEVPSGSRMVRDALPTPGRHRSERVPSASSDIAGP